MKKQFLFVITLIVVYTSSYSQSQLNHWYISPKKMDMSLSPPIPSTISPTFGGVSAATVVQVANGMYDKAGNLLFYVSTKRAIFYFTCQMEAYMITTIHL